MALLRALVVLVLAVGVQAGVGRLWPQAHRFVDLLMLPVIWYSIQGSQRSGMLVGCAAGLLQDTWFHVGAFGLNGFKKTLIGWAIGGIGTRLDLRGSAGRFAAGVSASLADVLLDGLLRMLFDLSATLPGLLEIVGRPLLTGFLAVWAFDAVARLRDSRAMRRWTSG